MNPANYVKLAVNTESKPNEDMRLRLWNDRLVRLLHAGMGMCTEAGEFQDALKKHIFYGMALDDTNLQEEIGDMLWYCALACDTLKIDMGEVMKRNIAKLATRYPDKFKGHDALIRDLQKERRVLEGDSE